jgi:hypothetical protein
MNDDLEQRILRQPPRKIPPAWRMDILTAARPESPKAVASIFPVPFSKPDRLAWTALAAVWVIILALNLANRELSPRAIFKSVPMTPELRMALLEQRRLLTELSLGKQPVSGDAEEPKQPSPRPHSERSLPFLKA